MKKLNVSSGLKDSRRGLVFVNERTLKDLDLLLDDPVLLALIDKSQQSQTQPLVENQSLKSQVDDSSSADNNNKQIQFTSVALVRVNNDLKENGIIINYFREKLI